MSSKYVRDETKVFLDATFPTSKIVHDMAAEDEEFSFFIEKYGIDKDDEWLGVQFLPASEEPRSLSAGNSFGCYREEGGIFIHVVAPVGNDARDLIIATAEEIRNAFRSLRYGSTSDIAVRSITPPSFEDGATLQFDDGFTSASVILDYYRDFNL